MKNISSNYYIAETAFHHEGDLTFLNSLVEDLLKLDINAIKFHLLFDINDYMIENHTAIDVIKRISIKQEDWPGIFSLVKESKKDIIALTNDVSSMMYINSIQNNYPIEAIEIHSTGLNDVFLLEEAGRFKKTIILGVGGSTFDEIQFAVDFLRRNNKNDILLMHGFQNYPTNYEDINFSRISLLKEAFGLPVGYADHTDPQDQYNIIMSVFPISYGVRVFEKHITNRFGEKRIDSQAAIDMETMKKVIEQGNALLKTFGGSKMQFSNAELSYGNTGPMKKAMVARRTIQEGEVISLADIAYKRTELSSMLLQKDIFKIIGARAKQSISKDDLLTFDNLEYKFTNASFEQFFIK
ncbi:N-acetylneuraminate synthase family protein [Sphingobacterium sp.]|uniref:N-acetylneuraminate synthase family protein n=1 Tax=Sphingobacterium sp. TaxID=341027 RepID=UPI002FD901A1